MKTREEAIAYALTFPESYRDAPFRDQNWQLVRWSGNRKAFLWTYERDGQICINVKGKPDSIQFFRLVYDSVRPGWHQNKDHWNTVILDGSIPDETIEAMIEESYLLISDSPSRRIYEAVKSIPRGRVATYGQVAALAGNPKMSRAVGNALHKNPDPEHIPCHRVVNAQGRLADEFVFGGPGVQAQRLREEGVEVVDGKVDLGKYGV